MTPTPLSTAARGMACALTILLLACGGRGEDATNDAAPGDAAATSAADTDVVVALTERDMERFLTVMRELKRLGVGYDADASDPGSAIAGMASAWAANREAMAILQANDLDVVRLQQLTYTIAMAMAASEMEGNAAKMQESAAQIEAMKGQLPPEMYEQMKQGQEAAEAMTRVLLEQPPGNVELVRRYRAELDALGR